MQTSVILLSLLTWGVMAGAVFAWMFIVDRLRKGKSVVPFEPRRLVPWNGIDLLAAAAIFIVAQTVCLHLAIRFFDARWPEELAKPTPDFELALFTANLLASALILLACVCLLRLRAGATLTDLGIALDRMPYDFTIGAAAFAAAAPVVYGIQIILTEVIGIEYNHQLINAVKEGPSGLMLWVATVSAVIAAPVLEEFLFRVLLQGWLEKAYLSWQQRGQVDPPLEILEAAALEGPLGAPIDEPPGAYPPELISEQPISMFWISPPVFISSALFALVHWGQGAAPIPLFFLGLVLGYLYQQTHRWLPSITVHMLLNGISMLVFFFAPAAK